MPPCLLSRHGWFWPVCASTPAVVPDGEKVEHSLVERAPGSNSIGRLRMRRNSGRDVMETLCLLSSSEGLNIILRMSLTVPENCRFDEMQQEL
ncbi:hypothetical protein B296_00017286 [Ensete ventricosum]|uniref:Uncharacterized protein n=1 Tax=Ensete ventricosum TaxID=4639 RepID=A0A427A7I9_ENSVE|nr:hypothetical protein B296_00017286 [Ensete ventricosum]